jgi:hypothetical protein
MQVTLKGSSVSAEAYVCGFSPCCSTNLSLVYRGLNCAQHHHAGLKRCFANPYVFLLGCTCTSHSKKPMCLQQQGALALTQRLYHLPDGPALHSHPALPSFLGGGQVQLCTCALPHHHRLPMLFLAPVHFLMPIRMCPFSPVAHNPLLNLSRTAHVPPIRQQPVRRRVWHTAPTLPPSGGLCHCPLPPLGHCLALHPAAAQGVLSLFQEVLHATGITFPRWLLSDQE